MQWIEKDDQNNKKKQQQQTIREDNMFDFN